MVLELWTANRLHAAHLVVLGSAGALVLFGANSPSTRHRSWSMPRDTTWAELTTYSYACSNTAYSAAPTQHGPWRNPHGGYPMHLSASGWLGMNQVTEPPAVGVLGGYQGTGPGQSLAEAGQGGSKQESHLRRGVGL